ncbi:MAG: hypothetical protein ACK478_06870 [Flavobacteriales bacterium]|jgi:hypothetical protein
MMDTLKDVLLVFTIVLLVYVLYQRLLQVLGKKQKSTLYATVGENLNWNGSMLLLQLEAARTMELEVAVKDADGVELIRQAARTLAIGSHEIEVDCSSLTKGRYYVWLKTPAQEYSRYFEISE